MSILVKDMKMPRSCFVCPFSCAYSGNGFTIFCQLTGKTIEAPTCEEKRLEDCPLIEIPAADVRPVVRGKWKDYNEYPWLECSNCGFVESWYVISDNGWHFCPNCGARMDGEA